MKSRIFVKGIAEIVLSSVVIISCYLNFEPMVANGAADSITVTQSVTSEVSLSSPADVTMSPGILGMTGGSATGSATWTVKTNDTSGFNLKIKSDAANCLRNGSDHFDDYTEASAGVPDYSWIATTISGFGYTVETATPGDTVAAFRDNGTACNTGALNTADKCWDGLSTTDATIVSRNSITSSSGEAETVKFKSELASGQFLPEGNYVATITVTATTN